MRFVGRPNKILMKGAPGNFNQGEVYQMSFNNSKQKFWELIEEPPVLKAPELKESDSVYEEPVYVPEEVNFSMEEETVVVHPPDVNIDPDAPSTLSPPGYQVSSDDVVYTDTASDEPEPTPAAEVLGERKLDRDDLKAILDEAGVVYKKNAHTKTLQKLVDAFVSKE